MPTTANSTAYISNEMSACLKRFWGYTQFRPWQAETILAILDERETLTILPTGGGKSLCFQLPALLKGGMAVVISPLISLMKDQVDGLKDMGIPAECLNSSQPASLQRKVIDRIRILQQLVGGLLWEHNMLRYGYLNS